MKNGKRIYLSIFWAVLGTALIICGTTGIIKNDIWTDIGWGWLACGALQLIRHMRYKNNAAYREKYDTETSDERNRYIAAKAWGIAGYCFVLTAGISALFFAAIGQKSLAQLACGGVCLIITIYWISYFYLRKKY